MIGISFAGPLARTVLSDGIFAALDQAVSDEILKPIMDRKKNGGPIVDTGELDAVRSVVEKSLVLVP